MSNPSFQQIPDAYSSQSFFTIAFRPRVPPSTTPKALPRQEIPSTPQDDEMVDAEPGEVNDEKNDWMSHTPESFSRPSTADTRFRSRSPRRERRGHGRYRERSRSCSPLQEQSRDYRKRSSRRGRRVTRSTEDERLSRQYSSPPSPSLHPTGGWEADFWPPLQRTSPRSRGVQVSDSYRPPLKTFLEQVEERSRMIALREAGVPDAPKAFRMTFAEQVEARAKTIALVAEGAPEGLRGSENAPKKQDLTGWFPDRPVEACQARRTSTIAFGEGGVSLYQGDTVMFLKNEHTVSQNDGRLSRPDSINGQDEEIHDDLNTNEKSSMEDESVNKPSSNAKRAKLKSTFNQLQSWIADQPTTPARPLPAVPRSYAPNHTLSRVSHTPEKFKDLSMRGTEIQPTLRVPACMQEPPGYPQEDLNYD